MKRIFKYSIPIQDDFVVLLPMHAQILTIQMQKSVPFIWCLVDPEQQITIERQFKLYGTGMIIDRDSNIYIGSFQMLAGALVYHLFEQCELPF